MEEDYNLWAAEEEAATIILHNFDQTITQTIEMFALAMRLATLLSLLDLMNITAASIQQQHKRKGTL